MFKKKKKSISDITEFQEIEETNGYPIIKCKNGYTYFLNVKGHDLASLKAEEYMAFKEQFLNLYKGYADDLKLIILTIKTETYKNIDYMKKKLETANEINAKWLEHQIKILETLNQDNEDMIFVLCIFDKTKKELLYKRSLIKGILGNTAEDFTKKRLCEIIYKLYNK